MSISVCKRSTKYPREAGDIGDIGDIFRKSLKFLDFLKGHAGDISGDIFSDGDLSPRPAPTEVFPKWKQFRNPRPHLSDFAASNLRTKKSLTPGDTCASPSMSLSTGSVFFAAGCCDSRGPFFAEKVLKHDFSSKIQIRKYF